VQPIDDLPRRIRIDAPVVTVAGDAILDRWWMGGSRRLSREAPAPIVELASQIDAPGGAANTAMNLRAMGARVRLVAVVGADAAGDRMLELLESAGVDVDGVLRSPLVRTVTKTRIVADDQVLVRADVTPAELGPPARADLARDLGAALSRALDATAALVVSDYGSGVLAEAVRRGLERMPRPDHVVVDAHDGTSWRWLAADVAVPNAQEAAALIFQKLGEANLPPIHPWGDSEARHLDFLPEKLGQTVGWGMTAAPPSIARWFDFDPSVLAKLPPQPVLDPEPEPAMAMA